MNDKDNGKKALEMIKLYRETFGEPFPYPFGGSNEEIIATVEMCIKNNKPIERDPNVIY